METKKLIYFSNLATKISLQPVQFEAIVAVNLTSFLVLTTMFTFVSDSLPKTAYLKLIDNWYIQIWVV